MIYFHIDPEDIKRIIDMLNRLEPKRGDSAFRNGLRKASSSVVGRLTENVSGIILHRRTGRLAQSIGFRIEGKGRDMTAEMGSGATVPFPRIVSGRQGVTKSTRVVYANIHERGGVIKPKRAKWLTIPLPEALTKSGSQLKGGALGARDFPNTFFMRSKAGNLLIMQRKGKNKIVPLFVLKKSVTIPARHYLSITARETNTKVVDDIVTTLQKEIDK